MTSGLFIFNVASGLEAALDLILSENDKEMVIVKHELEKGEVIEPHAHEDAVEYIVATEGEFVVVANAVQEICEVMGDKTLVVRIEKGHEHSFRALSPIRYFVIRG